MSNNSFQITEGTQTLVATDKVGGAGGTNYQVVKLDMGGAAATAPFTGTFIELTNQVGGTLQRIGTVQSATITTGTVNTGTVDSISQLPPNSWGTTVSTGTTTLGTIKPAVAGSAIFVTDMIISIGTLASNLVIGMGGTSTPLIGTLSFAANGGMVSNFRIPASVTLGSALVYQQSSGVALTITATGFVR